MRELFYKGFEEWGGAKKRVGSVQQWRQRERFGCISNSPAADPPAWSCLELRRGRAGSLGFSLVSLSPILSIHPIHLWHHGATSISHGIISSVRRAREDCLLVRGAIGGGQLIWVGWEGQGGVRKLLKVSTWLWRFLKCRYFFSVMDKHQKRNRIHKPKQDAKKYCWPWLKLCLFQRLQWLKGLEVRIHAETQTR